MRARVSIFFIVVILAFIIFKFSFFSNDTKYSNFHTISNSDWLLKDTLIFDFINENNDIDNHGVTIFGKINQEYTYANLILFIDFFSENNRIKRDTLNCNLYDNFGFPQQKNIGNMQFFKLEYLSTFKFEANKNYKFRIIHGMRDSNLIGIETIGIKINEN